VHVLAQCNDFRPSLLSLLLAVAASMLAAMVVLLMVEGIIPTRSLPGRSSWPSPGASTVLLVRPWSGGGRCTHSGIMWVIGVKGS